MKKNKILITGVAGFLGSNLAKALVDRGDNVVGLDNLCHGTPSRLLCLKDSRFQFVQGDVRHKATLDKFTDVSHVVHFAELKVPRYGGALEMLEVNYEGTESVLNFAKARNAAFLFGSSDEVYGKCPEDLLNEESPLVIGPSDGQRWGYAVSKVMGEHLCFATTEIPTTILRFSGVYGPTHSIDWQGGVPAVFIQAALEGKAMPIHGDGLQRRTFTYVDDAVAGTLAALSSDYVHGEIVNIASTETLSIINLAYLIWRLVGRSEKPQLEFQPYTDFSANYEDVRVRVIDTSKASSLLGYEAKVSLNDGLRATIQWQKKHVSSLLPDSVTPPSISKRLSETTV